MSQINYGYSSLLFGFATIFKKNKIMNLFSKVFSASIILMGTAFIYKVAIKRNSVSTSRISSNSSDNDNLSHYSHKSVLDNGVDTRTQNMYKDLGMTENQRNLYEASMKSIVTDWKKNNPNDIMDDRNNLLDEDKSLRAVLNEVQYGMYRDWNKNYKN